VERRCWLAFPLVSVPPLRWLDTTASTQDLLLEAARAGRDPQALATTDQQAGHGRRGREWACPPGDGLALSVLLRPARADGWTWLPLLTGVGVLAALHRLGVGDPVLKWPNDVLVRGGKLAGLLADRVEGTGAPAVVLGMGLNLRPGALPPQAVALDALLPGRAPGPAAVAEALLEAVLVVLGAWERGEDAAVREAYRQRCATLGRCVVVTLPGGDTVAGRAVDVDADGRLVVQGDDGRLVPLSAGDVVHLRA